MKHPSSIIPRLPFINFLIIEFSRVHEISLQKNKFTSWFLTKVCLCMRECLNEILMRKNAGKWKSFRGGRREEQLSSLGFLIKWKTFLCTITRETANSNYYLVASTWVLIVFFSFSNFPNCLLYWIKRWVAQGYSWESENFPWSFKVLRDIWERKKLSCSVERLNIQDDLQ